MKKFLTLFLSLACFTSFVGCGSNTNNNNTSSPTQVIQLTNKSFIFKDFEKMMRIPMI